ncbi:excisionase [Mycobacterium phage Barriga]|uniref:metallo-phosphoesterase n=1 Tax=Mycobacterium phage Barriga TaxID=1675548 RepID=UPI0006A28791|nr:metallo-phosphoesterase [Mycobacterium phage Barriga]AKU44921.1 excisionase [Mycobacterium phage Barriga]
MTKRIVVVSDIQAPFHSRKAVAAVIQYIADTQPDQVIQIGDLLDLPQPSRWSKGTKGEFEGSIFRDAEGVKREFLEPLRAVYDGWIGIHEGNHDLRGRQYLERYAPALAESRAFDMDILLDFDGFGIEMLPDFHQVAPGWLTTHGHMGKISLSQIAGSTALNAAKKFHQSVVMGHTHRLAVVSHSFGYAGTIVRTVTGMEVGHLMDMKKAAYLAKSTANWQMGFGILTVDGKHVKAEGVPISQGKFTVDGETWRL